jgi:pimeloyl-ACP methyl ester carboxylesterase
MTQALPTLGYQNQMASGIVEQRLKTKDDMKSFFNTMYLGTTPAGLPAFSLNSGLNFNLMPSIRKSPLLSAQDLEYYATEYTRHGLKGPCNWYRTSELNFKDDRAIKNLTIGVPTMYIDTSKSSLIPADIMKSSKSHIPNLTSRSVNTNHWAMLEDAKGVNKHIKDWVEQVVFGGKQKI